MLPRQMPLVLVVALCFGATAKPPTIATLDSYVFLFKNPYRTIGGQPRDFIEALRYYAEAIRLRDAHATHKNDPQRAKVLWDQILAHNKREPQYGRFTVRVPEPKDRVVKGGGIIAYKDMKTKVILKNLPAEFNRQCRVLAWPVESIMVDGFSMAVYDYGIPSVPPTRK